MPIITLTDKDQAMLMLLSAKQAGAVIHSLLGREVKLDDKSEAVYRTIKTGMDRRGKDRERKQKTDGISMEIPLENPQKFHGNSVESPEGTPPFLPPSPFPPTPPLFSPPYNPPTTTTACEEGLGKVMSLFFDRVNSAPSPICLNELSSYTQTLSPPVVERVICEAVDQGKASWPYIRKVLQSKQQRGITSLVDWDKWENERERRKQHGSVTSYPPNESGRAADEKWGIRSALVVGD